MFRWAAILGLAGLAAATGIVIWSGWAQVADALAQAGWGIVAIALFHCVSLVISSAGWRMVVPGKHKPSLTLFVYFMWVRAAVNNLMPVARIGGEIAAIRLMTAHGMRKSTAIAATVVELTLSIVAMFVFVLIGVILFALRMNDSDSVRQLMWGLALSLPVIVALGVVQRIGFFGLLSKLFRLMFRDKYAAMVGSAALLDRAVKGLYRRSGRAIGCGLMQFLAWSLGTIEIWLTLRFLGNPVSLLDSLMIEALIQGSASAAFAVPGALGVQEAGFVVFGGMLGIPPGIAGALAITRRCRDLLCYVPGLIIWQAHEGKRLLKK